MTKEECYQLGHIIKTHGLKGELSIYLDVDEVDYYEELEVVYIETKGQLLPYFVEEIQLLGTKSIIKLEGINHIDEAKTLVGLKVYLPDEMLPELEDGEYFLHEIIGFEVIDVQKGLLGKIETIYNMPQQNLISMQYQGKEVMIPINDAIVTKVDKEQQKVFVALPDGLLEVYLEE